MEKVTVTRELLSLDLILFRRYGTDGQALLSETLALNPGLAALGAHLPLGTTVILPPAPNPSSPIESGVIDLFGAIL